ncbi:hypothetical protein Y032_0690g1563 [Ancylostoma ceylanicum]|uniref:G-protein coupled receptors family 1 profile domain-containing protein n=1 Tax=Ancylostoma ceylanicum TaxID=53326 RepID=A0A016WGA4_9BILA|nr:hypothetical protein Y032_0690g1563 [Ancylostoma ceylanicum]
MQVIIPDTFSIVESSTPRPRNKMNAKSNSFVINVLYVCIAEGVFAVALNIPVVAAMLSSSSLRNSREFHVVMGISAADAVYGFAFVLTAINRIQSLKDYHHAEIPEIPRWKCATQYNVHLITMAYQLQAIQTLTVAIDRLLAITIPTRYLKFDFRYNIFLSAGPYVFVFIASTTNALLALQDSTMVSSFCRTPTAVTPGFFDYISLLRIICILISAFIYVLVIVKLSKQTAKMGKMQAPGFGSSQLRGLRRCTITVGPCFASFFKCTCVILYIRRALNR